MNHIPADLSPATAAWLHAQIVINNARTAAVLREEIDKVDDWANGLFVVFTNVLPHMLQTHPELAAKLAPQWKTIAARFERLQTSGERRTRDGESLELLEARKMLYRIFEVMGLWPAPSRAKRSQ